MAQLDRLLSVVAGNRADGLRLVQDGPAMLLKGGVEQPVTRQSLTITQVLALVREVAPDEATQRLQRGEPAQFEYAFGNDVYTASARYRDGQLTVEVAPRTPFARANGNGADALHAAHPSLRPTPHATAAQMEAREAAELPERAGAEDPEARAQIEALLRLQAERRASDLHLRSGERPLLRVDGDIVPLDGQEPLAEERLARMVLALMSERNRREFDELSDTDLAYELEGAGRYRVNVFRDRRGVGAVIRAVPSKVVSVEEMEITPEVQNLCRLNKGLVLVTGPTGSGKSTTLCALIDLVNRTRHDHIVTIEDPIEFVHQNKGCLITQRQVGTHTSSFKHALRAALREDPDVVLVGELRDLETVSIAIETAETGHLVFGTLHTSTAASTIDRVIDQFPSDRQSQIRVMLSESLKGVISQVLCRKVGGGRLAAREILLSTPAISNLIREGKTFQIPSVVQTSRRLGMLTLNDALLELAEQGKIEASEAYGKAIDKSAILQGLKTRGHDVSFVEGGKPRE
ncbi:MAG TPA: type IV pilus twitching motility protein PilT [Gemmatimonadaceae bacterium]|nr:type IV pilus twitching motility protein PilT [Gemmatimonadaceae bacterium]